MTARLCLNPTGPDLQFDSHGVQVKYHCDSCWRGAIDVAQHGVKGTSKVVGKGTAVIILGRWHQACQHQQQQEEQVQGKCSSQNTVEERPASRNFPARQESVR